MARPPLPRLPLVTSLHFEMLYHRHCVNSGHIYHKVLDVGGRRLDLYDFYTTLARDYAVGRPHPDTFSTEQWNAVAHACLGPQAARWGTVLQNSVWIRYLQPFVHNILCLDPLPYHDSPGCENETAPSQARALGPGPAQGPVAPAARSTLPARAASLGPAAPQATAQTPQNPQVPTQGHGQAAAEPSNGGLARRPRGETGQAKNTQSTATLAASTMAQSASNGSGHNGPAAGGHGEKRTNGPLAPSLVQKVAPLRPRQLASSSTHAAGRTKGSARPSRSLSDSDTPPRAIGGASPDGRERKRGRGPCGKGGAGLTEGDEDDMPLTKMAVMPAIKRIKSESTPSGSPPPPGTLSGNGLSRSRTPPPHGPGSARTPHSASKGAGTPQRGARSHVAELRPEDLPLVPDLVPGKRRASALQWLKRLAACPSLAVSDPLARHVQGVLWERYYEVVLDVRRDLFLRGPSSAPALPPADGTGTGVVSTTDSHSLQLPSVFTAYREASPQPAYVVRRSERVRALPDVYTPVEYYPRRERERSPRPCLGEGPDHQADLPVQRCRPPAPPRGESKWLAQPLHVPDASKPFPGSFPPDPSLKSKLRAVLRAAGPRLPQRNAAMEALLASLDRQPENRQLQELGSARMGAKERQHWKPSEEDAFASGIAVHGRDFESLRDGYLPDRSVSDVVAYYYNVWKIRYNPAAQRWHAQRHARNRLAGSGSSGEGYELDEDADEDGEDDLFKETLADDEPWEGDEDYATGRRRAVGRPGRRRGRPPGTATAVAALAAPRSAPAAAAQQQRLGGGSVLPTAAVHALVPLMAVPMLPLVPSFP